MVAINPALFVKSRYCGVEGGNMKAVHCPWRDIVCRCLQHMFVAQRIVIAKTDPL
jgi:hypothetical protein